MGRHLEYPPGVEECEDKGRSEVQCECGFNKTSETLPEGHVRSLCGWRASLRGQGQRVISYSIFGPLQGGGYFSGILENLRGIRKLYPGYVMRLYHNASHSDTGFQELCDIYCHSDSLDLCHVHSIDQYPGINNMFGMLWRFAPLADPTVSEFHSRDLDSRISEREVAAVKDWHNTGRGMFGAKITEHNFAVTKNIWEKIYTKAKGGMGQKGYDQVLLTQCFWYPAQSSLVIHDSFLCNTFVNQNTRPFPTQRIPDKPFNFVGSNGGQINRPCPEQCRPPDHTDWMQC
eukprot:maker-scaffold415_size178368-snap-gene-0.26 protein:Tk01170 transcript:maker-scaffold415_size178368-snap-gene-0.26-mRNA-1 annotation:"hypothetical protein DAPPUDRAFT_96285"